MNYRDLETVRQIILDATGLEVSYAYDDLVFPEQTIFMIQFDDKDVNHLYCYFQEDCKEQARKNVIEALEKECTKKECSLTYNGTFELDLKGENMDIKFKPLKSVI